MFSLPSQKGGATRSMVKKAKVHGFNKTSGKEPNTIKPAYSAKQNRFRFTMEPISLSEYSSVNSSKMQNSKLIQPATLKMTWKCHICTFENVNTEDKCDACDTLRPHKFQDKKSLPLLRNIKTSKPTITKQDEPEVLKNEVDTNSPIEKKFNEYQDNACSGKKSSDESIENKDNSLKEAESQPKFEFSFEKAKQSEDLKSSFTKKIEEPQSAMNSQQPVIENSGKDDLTSTSFKLAPKKEPLSSSFNFNTQNSTAFGVASNMDTPSQEKKQSNDENPAGFKFLEPSKSNNEDNSFLSKQKADFTPSFSFPQTI